MSSNDLVRAVLVRRRGTFILVLLAFVVTAAIVVSVLPKRYEASASLFVGQDRPISASGSAQRDDVLAKSYAELLAAPLVADGASRVFGGGVSRSELLGRMSFVVTPGTQLIAVTASGDAPDDAARLANVYAETFVETRRRTEASARRSRLDQLQRNISETARRVVAAEEDGGSSTERNNALAQLQSLRRTYQALNESLALEGSNLSLATRAAAPLEPAAPQPLLYLAAALLLGSLFAAAAAVLRDRVDRRLWDEGEVLRVTGAPIIARIPKDFEGDDAQVAEVFGFLRVNLQSRSSANTVVVTSPSAGDGKSTVVMGLSRSMARSGSSVIAADFDFRRHELTRLQTVSGVGLQDVVTGTASVDEALVDSGSPNLRIAATTESVAPELLDRQSIGHLVQALGKRAQFVIFDTAPVTVAVETSVLASSEVDAVILVIDLRKTRSDALAAAIDQLARTGVRLEGVVVNRVDRGPAYAYGPAKPRQRDARRAATAGSASGR